MRKTSLLQKNITEAFKKKGDMINRFYQRAENRKHTEFRHGDQKSCKWCDQFREVDMMGCLNCGKKLK